MHEEAMLRDVVRNAEEVARREGPGRVTRVRLWIGASSHLGGPELEARWADAVRGTVLAGAKVEIELSHDPHHPHAGTIVMRSLDLDSAESSRGT
jgi:Zn finger protein HypA/HybF involved in hydrogenase expression